jgi:hypothetical protein
MGQASLADGFTTVTYEATGLGFSALGIIPASNTVDLFGKIGLMFWDAKVSVSGQFAGSEDDDGSDMMFGFAANIGLNEKSL